MRKSSKLHTKKVSVLDEEEGERQKKAEGKKAIIRAEFEKHKKEMMISVSEASKMNEIRLKNQLEELLNINEKKQKDLARLENTEQHLEKHNTEATQFFETVSRFEFSKHSDACLTVGYHPNRTTSSIWEMKENNTAEKLGEKMAELMETLANVELLLEEEDEIQSSVQEKYDEIKKDHILQSKKVNELNKIYDHGNKRFVDLQRIEFLAWNKHAAAASDLKELKDDLKELKDKEFAYKKQKEEDKRRETEYLHSKQNEMANVLIDLDKKRQEFLQSQEEIKRLDLQFEEMRDKRKNNRIVTKYIETFNALAEKKINLVAAHQALAEMSARLDALAENSPNKFEGGTNPFTFGMDTSHLPAAAKRGSVIERNSYIDRIQRLYERYPEGPQQLANTLIQRYVDQCYQEESLKGNYEELQQNKRRQESELQILEEELQLLKGKNEYIDQGKSGSKILDSNEQEAIDSGMLVVASMPTTINQAKFEVENKQEADNHATQFITTEAFMMRCYMDSIEMISRFSKLLNSIYSQSGGQLSEDMKELAKLAKLQTTMLKRSKKLKPEMSASQLMTEAFPELHRTHTDNSSVSEREKEVQEPVIILDLNEVYELFLSIFELEEEKATEFIDNIKGDVMIITFISIEDIKNYLLTCQGDYPTESNVQRAIARVTDLRKTAIENMMQRFEAIYKLYSEVVTTTRQGNNELYRYFKQRGLTLPKEDFMGRESESNQFIKRAVEKKWKTLLTRYDYDPARDYRKDAQETDVTDHNMTQNPKEKTEDTAEMNEESWDREDTKAKLNEIVGAMSNKPTFKGKREEDLRRLQAKKDKERQKQALENMTDDDFLNWQRRQIKKDGKDDFIVTEINEGELLRKAQADQAQRLSSSAAPIEELKRMIENSKVLAKIQILEKQKCATDGKRNLKYEPTENYIPHEPLKIQKSPSVNQTYNIRITRNVYTPTTKPAGSRLFAISTDRMTESENDATPKDLSFKTSFPKSASKFKPIDNHFDLNSEPTLDNEKPHTQVGQKRMRTLDNFKGVPSLLSKPAVPQTASKELRTKKLLVDSMQVKKGDNNGELKLLKNKGAKSTLPKLEKTGKKKNGGKKKKKNSFELVASEHDNLNNFLKIQTDPLLKMVYSPTFFATTAPTTAYTSEDLGYRFDSYKFTTSGLLVSENL